MADYVSQRGPAVEQRGIDSLYSFYLGIHLMVYIGFGYLMTFLRRNGFEALGYTILLSAICFQWGILNQAFWENVHEGAFHEIKLNVLWLVEGDFSAATFLITFGALLGKATRLQLFLVAVVEVMIYAFNFYLYTHVFEAIDVGGSVVIHMAGAIFGLGVSYTLFPSNVGDHPDNTSNYTSDRFSMIGTLILWLYWPSFNGVFAGDNQDRVAINTVLSLCGSAVAAFCCSRMFRATRKFEMMDIANATLAGGVAVGSAADLMIGPGAALLVGVTGGTVSTLGFIYLTPFLESKFGLTDTCGVINLHGTPGIIGSLAGIISIGTSGRSVYGQEFDDIFPQGNDQWKFQLAGLVTSFAIMSTTGLLVGFVVKKLTAFQIRSKEDMYGDHSNFEIETAEYDFIRDVEEKEPLLSKRQISDV